MEPCQTCGTVLVEDWTDVYCAACLEEVHEALADALLEAFLPHY